MGFDTAADIIASIDCYVMGARTYELALELGWPYGDVPVVVLTHRDLPNDRNSVEFYAGDLTSLVRDRLQPTYRDIWVVGGAELVREFLRLDLADAIRLTIAPTHPRRGPPVLRRSASSARCISRTSPPTRTAWSSCGTSYADDVRRQTIHRSFSNAGIGAMEG